MPASMNLLRIRRPHLAAQQLHRHPVAGIQPLDLCRNIDQAIGLDHRGENPRPLIAGRPDLEHTLFTGEHAAQKVAAIGPL